MPISIKISDEFTDAPGARYKTDGPKSGEEFLEKLLEPKYLQAVASKDKLVVDLDDVWGYASSFISGSFGALSMKYTPEAVMQVLSLICKDNPLLITKIEHEIKKPNKK